MWLVAHPASSPGWISLVANYLVSLPIALVAAGAALIYLPLSRPISVVEIGWWLVASGLLVEGLLWALGLVLIFWPLSILLLLALVVYVAWWVLPSHRGLEVVNEALIVAPPERLFFLAIEPRSQLRLSPAVKEAFVKGGGGLGVGSIIVSRTGMRGFRITGEDMLVDYDPPHRYTERTLNAPPNQLTVTFESLGEQTRVACRYVGQLSLPNAIVSGLLRGVTRRQLRVHRERWLHALRREAATS